MAAKLSEEVASCMCGNVQMQTTGTPITRVVCYCDDCQAGSSQIAKLPRAPSPIGTDGGTDYVLFRKDRVRCIKGEPLLRPNKLKESSATNRYVASCCNTFMYMSFDDARHWVPVWAARFRTPPAPVSMRICANFSPRPEAIPTDAPIHQSYPLTFMAKLVAAWIPMLLRR